jgi:hypothetical protein
LATRAANYSHGFTGSKRKLKSFSDSVFKIISIPCEWIYSVISILGKFVYNCVINILGEEKIREFFRNLQELLQPIFDFFRDRVKRWIIDIIRPSCKFVSSRFKIFVQEDGFVEALCKQVESF